MIHLDMQHPHFQVETYKGMCCAAILHVAALASSLARAPGTRLVAAHDTKYTDDTNHTGN